MDEKISSSPRQIHCSIYYKWEKEVEHSNINKTMLMEKTTNDLTLFVIL